MPRVSSWLVRTAFGWLVAGAGLGALMLAGKGEPWLMPIMRWRTAHQDMLLAGWLLQLVMGVGLWILPRPPGEAPDARRGRIVVLYLLINAGVVLAAMGGAPAGRPELLVAGRILEGAAAALAAMLLVPRIRPYGLGAGTSKP